MTPGTALELVIFGTENGLGDDEDFNISCEAQVVRIDAGAGEKRPPGFGVTINPVDADHSDRLSKLLARASGYGVGQIV